MGETFELEHLLLLSPLGNERSVPISMRWEPWKSRWSHLPSLLNSRRYVRGPSCSRPCPMVSVPKAEESEVFARSVTASFDVNRVEELAEFGESVKDRIASFSGLREWRFVADVSTGRAVSFSTFDDETAFLESKDEIDSILSALSQFLVDRPVEILGEVVVEV